MTELSNGIGDRIRALKQDDGTFSVRDALTVFAEFSKAVNPQDLERATQVLQEFRREAALWRSANSAAEVTRDKEDSRYSRMEGLVRSLPPDVFEKVSRMSAEEFRQFKRDDGWMNGPPPKKYRLEAEKNPDA